MPFFGTGWAAGHIVVPYGAEFGVEVVEDPELGPTRGFPAHLFRLSLWFKDLSWNGLPGNQSGKLLAGHLGKRIQIAHLTLNVFTSIGKPKR
jgi:hypothetical protein